MPELPSPFPILLGVTTYNPPPLEPDQEIRFSFVHITNRRPCARISGG
jgi:hypothetical protein